MNILSGEQWEGINGFSRAVRVGNIIEVSGRTPVDGNLIIGMGDLYTQTKFILQKVEYPGRGGYFNVGGNANQTVGY